MTSLGGNSRLRMRSFGGNSRLRMRSFGGNSRVRSRSLGGKSRGLSETLEVEAAGVLGFSCLLFAEELEGRLLIALFIWGVSRYFDELLDGVPLSFDEFGTLWFVGFDESPFGRC